MKNFIFSSLFIFLTQLCYGQWLPNGALAGPIYYNGGNVGIGTGSTPNTKFEVRGPSVRISDISTRYLEISQNDQGKPYGRNFTNSYAGGRQFKFSSWSHQPDNMGSSLKDIIHFDGYNLFLLKDNGGSVGIGTSILDAQLCVKGTIHTNEVKVDLLGAVAPDYVFESTYKLPSLTEVQVYINENKHLPEVPSAKEMEENGVYLKEMNLILLKKVEELTLYVIEQNEKLENQANEIESIKKQLLDIVK